MRKTLAFCLLSAGLLIQAPAAQARVWTAPEGCEIFLTVQAKLCRVSNHYRCSADPKGDQWRADFDQEGLFFQSRINAETEWVESFDGVSRTQLEPNPADPARFSELVGSGLDSFEFQQSDDMGGRSLVSGYDRLTGKVAVIDGVTLDETEFDFTETDMAGNILRRGRGFEYISREWRMFFSGPGEADFGDGQWRPLDGSPVDFIFPGEKGFAATQPMFDCDALTAEASPAQAPIWRAKYTPGDAP
ncbi:hypothetical protein Q9295_17590 [Xinfangfangia sp. CPCC 101601]|uniref:DUF3108 domain-containing protein n=1 Tax=Pseudogemmobacter lacusdianii TaxID=3069608 RepID=A0ABU0W3Z5_9RHOB|nr:hypothetical protein [Xinfangfangia sp. CPCC 101601]MDQ2068185.1 hypothetical protein [Xinfangfangia sp. CPCC 101601]